MNKNLGGILTRAYKDLNMSMEEGKNVIISNINSQIEIENDEFTKDAMEQVKKFIENPEELSISAKPEKPLPLGSLMRTKRPKSLYQNVKFEDQVLTK